MIFLSAYATVEGQTRKIAQRIARFMEAAGHRAEIVDLGQPGFGLPARFDGAVVCGSVHAGRYAPELTAFARDWNESLNAMPSAFVSVSLAIASDFEDEREEAMDFPERLAEETGWRPQRVHHAKGALRYTEYDFFKRWMMRRIAEREGASTDTSRDHELTDWSALEEFVSGFIAHVKTSAQAGGVPLSSGA